jgi:hypothetical protein
MVYSTNLHNLNEKIFMFQANTKTIKSNKVWSSGNGRFPYTQFNTFINFCLAWNTKYLALRFCTHYQ